MSLVKIVALNKRGDERGFLTIVEQERTVPFNFKRIYFLTNLSKDLPRGFHAHKKLEQFAICITGSCRVLLDDGKSKEWVTLDNPNQGLRIEPMIWHEMHDFSPDCIFLVLASDFYDEDDYIREYNEFIEEVTYEF